MNVPESFFKGEIRNSFYVEKLMKKVWAAQLEVLHDVDMLCKKHNIQYFADYGTLLGAVRHKGFIPWDDDMDISMKREDYTKFCEIAQKELAGTYEIINIHTDPTWNQLLGRIINGREISFDDERLEKFHNCPFVVGLDIFPLDYLAPNKEEDELQCNIIRILQVTMNELEKDNLKEEEIISTIQAIENMCSVKFDRNRPYIIQIRELKERICMLYTNEESEYVASMGEHACKTPPELYVYPKEYYSSAIEVPFEYTTIPIPVGYEKILIQKYGENYMVPQIGGSNHDYPFYKEQLQLIYEANGNR
jgi:lipopolysaccharide cholinephosphotransferase